MYTEKDKKIEELQADIKKELNTLQKRFLRPIRDKDKYIKYLENRLRHAQWFNKKVELYSVQQPKMVKQREIFYCELGQNIGSEQEGRRPVVILQNNVGNAHAKITLVAPITSFQKGSIKTIGDELFLEDSRGNEPILRPLRFYDIPVELEEDSKYQIYGVVNISQIRVVNKSRLAQIPVASVTVENFEKIIDAITKNISIFEKDIDKTQ